MRPTVRRDDPRLQIMTEAIQGLIPGATPAFLSVTLAEQLPGSSDHRHTWTGSPAALAERVFTALYGRPRSGEELSPLARADEARHAGSIEGRFSALLQGGVELTSASWYPARPGDLVHVHYEADGEMAAFGETYRIAAGSHEGLLDMQLLCHTLPGTTRDLDALVGCFAVDDDPDPLIRVWFEAGPRWLTIVREGRPVHIGGAR